MLDQALSGHRTGASGNKASEATLDVFSTAFSEPNEKFEVWREAICRTFVALEPAITDPDGFAGEIKSVAVGGLLVSDICAEAQVVQRRKDDIRRSSTDMLYLIRQLQGRCDIRSDAGVASMSEGDCVLVDPHLPYELHFDRDFRQYCVQIPQWWLRQHVSHDQRLMIGHCIPSRLPIARVLGTTIDQLLEVGECRQSQIDVSEVFVDVLIRSLDALSKNDPKSSASRYRSAEQVFTYIARNFRDETISPTSAAEALGCSVRYVHKVCAMSGVTFNRMVLDARLSEAARSLLSSPPSASRISDIAYSSGFADLSHFCRLFKSRFGVSASAYRN